MSEQLDVKARDFPMHIGSPMTILTESKEEDGHYRAYYKLIKGRDDDDDAVVKMPLHAFNFIKMYQLMTNMIYIVPELQEEWVAHVGRYE